VSTLSLEPTEAMAISVTPRNFITTPSRADNRHGHRCIAPNTNPANSFDAKAAAGNPTG